MATSVDTMTSDQLRENLYHNLQGSGVLETMKSQMRQRLAKELHKAAPTRVKRSPKTAQKRPKSTPHQHSPDASTTTLTDHIASSIVAEHLKKAGFEYSLSVFLPEAGVNIDKLYSVEDLIQYLRISPSSPLYNKLVPSKQDQSLLVQLLEALGEASLNSSNGDKSTPSKQRSGSSSPDHQTSPKRTKRKSKGTSVAEQLQALDHSYAQKADEQRARTQHNLEERLLAFQQELEAQYKTQLETELSLYRTRELAKMRLEERERYQRELASERVESTRAHQAKIEELRKTEMQMLERFRKKEQDLEASIHSQRQNLLAELNALKLQEAELKRRSELNKRATSLEEERLNKLVEQLAGREKAIEQMKAHHESMAKDQAQKYKLELEAQLQLKQNELTLWESELKKDKDKMTSLRSEVNKLTVELQTERDKADRLQSLLHEAMGKQITLQGQKDSLQQKMDQMGGWDQLQKRSQELQQELTNAERKLSDYKRRNLDNQRLIKDLQSKVPRPTQELEALKKELDDIRKARHKEVYVMESDNRELSRQLAVQTEYVSGLQKRLDDQMVQLLSAQREVKDLCTLVEQIRGGKTGLRKNGSLSHRATATTNKRAAAVSKVSTTRHQPALPHSSHTHVSLDPHPSHTHAFTTPHPSHTHAFDTPHIHTTPTIQAGPLLTSALDHVTPSQGVGFTDMSSQLLAESRATFTRLEKEAEELEATYHHFQRGSDSTSLTVPNYRDSPMTPPVEHQTLHREHDSSETNVIPTSTLKESKACRSGSNEQAAVSQIHQPTLPLTSTVWAASPTMTAHPQLPDVSLAQHASAGLVVQTTVRSDEMVPSSVLTPPLGKSKPLISQPTAQLYKTPLSGTSTLTENALDKIMQSKSKSIATLSASLKTTVAAPCTSTTLPVTNSSPSSLYTPAPSQPELVQTRSSPPKISLDDLWKSSQQKSPPAPSSATTPSEYETRQKQLEEKERLRKAKQREEEERIKRELEALQEQDKLREDSSPVAASTASVNEEKPASLSTTSDSSQEGKEQVATENDGVDPVMLKYMELVKQKREQTTQVESQQAPTAVEDNDNSKLDFGFPPLSQASESFGGFSDKEDDPFEDW